MKIINSNKSYYMIIAGILVISILSIFMVFSLGVRGYCVYKPNATYPHSVGFLDTNKDASESNYSENNKIVSVAQSKELKALDTEKGSINVIGGNLPDWDKVPLCIKQSDLNGYYMLVSSCGGYTPRDGWSIQLYQDRDNVKSTKELIGTIQLIYTKVDSMSSCCCTVYNITFIVIGGCIHVDSNEFPDAPAGWDFSKGSCCCDLNKKVDIKVTTLWEGCSDQCQRFGLILTQNFVFRIPNSQQNILIIHCLLYVIVI
jgi:hypothetical protein